MINKKKVNIFTAFNYIFFIIICLITFYPLWYAIVASFMPEYEYLSTKFVLFPRNPTIGAYLKIFEDGRIFSHLKVTLFITIVGTTVSLFMTAFCAYGLSKKFFGSTIITYLTVFTMFIKPGLIPDYMTLKNLGLINNIMVYILPSMVNIFYLTIMRSNFKEFPKELEESAKIDGYNEIDIFFKIVLPLSKPILAAIGLFFAVQYWNTYMQSVFYITAPNLKTVQEYIKKLVSDVTDMQSLMMASESGDSEFSQETLRLANVVLVLVPILMVYPFLQKYFVKGLMVGAVKG